MNISIAQKERAVAPNMATPAATVVAKFFSISAIATNFCATKRPGSVPLAATLGAQAYHPLAELSGERRGMSVYAVAPSFCKGIMNVAVTLAVSLVIILVGETL